MLCFFDSFAFKLIWLFVLLEARIKKAQKQTKTHRANRPVDQLETSFPKNQTKPFSEIILCNASILNSQDNLKEQLIIFFWQKKDPLQVSFDFEARKAKKQIQNEL